MAISIRGGIHRLHDQNTTLPPMSASVCAPHFLVLPAVRPLSHVPLGRGGGSARVSDAPLQLHVRRHGTALPDTIDADGRTDAAARFGRKLGKRFTLDGQHGPAPHVVDEKTGFDAHRGICAIAVFDASE